jgi:hypothetical protein
MGTFRFKKIETVTGVETEIETGTEKRSKSLFNLCRSVPVSFSCSAPVSVSNLFRSIAVSVSVFSLSSYSVSNLCLCLFASVSIYSYV